MINDYFEWQDEYLAGSLSESMMPRVRQYIKNQEEHHRKKIFKEEHDLLSKNIDSNLGAKAPEAYRLS